MTGKVIDMTRRKDFRKQRLFVPDRPKCEIYDCKKMFRDMRKERILEAQRLRLRRELQRRSEQYPEFYSE